ncbi:hypothetical protein H632_c981p1 [Helicosporidium sp. ATCC 50920]|nr:hypothetical protein H632_c981p1 [Helicosporidium sp. ATCC 50920]|eukprot:KDD74930.1 hypothetical protein H632_c981p1 [Helicosporidium sp. ATCC 50920]
MPAHLELHRTRVICGPDINLHTESALSSNEYMPLGANSASTLDLASFKSNFAIEVKSYTEDEMTFEMRGASCALANALRRTMIAETPTMAIEHVFVVNNTSIIPDEMLAHRLGLVPLLAHPRDFEWRRSDESLTDRNCTVFRLKVRCWRDSNGVVVNGSVYSDALEWLPAGSEMPEETGCVFAQSQEGRLSQGPGPVEDKILLARLRPGQEIEIECVAVKGVGEDHAKFSPVATAWYRLLPEVVLLREVRGEDAHELQRELPGLVEVSPQGLASVDSSTDHALKHDKLLERVRRLSGEERWQGAIQLRKLKTAFLFTIQSTGAWMPHELFSHATRVVASKCDKVLEGLQTF